MTGEKARNNLVLALTLAAASVDAISYLGLDQVFTANMTGNTVLLGLALARLDAAGAVRSGIALVAFALGAALVALLPGRVADGRLWPSAVTGALAAELVLLAGFAGIWLVVGAGAPAPARSVLIAVAALAMGAQSGAVTRLGMRGVATTYVTGTVTSLATDVAIGRHGSGRRLRLGVLAVYVAGAIGGGAAYLGWGPTAALIPAAVVAVVAATAGALHAYVTRRTRRETV